MKKICLALAALVVGASTLSAQLPNPLNLPDPLGLSRPRQEESRPSPARPQQEREDWSHHRHARRKRHRRPLPPPYHLRHGH